MVAGDALDLWRGSDDVGYGVVLALIAVTYVASVSLTSSARGRAVVLVLQVVVVLIVLRVSHARRAVNAMVTSRPSRRWWSRSSPSSPSRSRTPAPPGSRRP